MNRTVSSSRSRQKFEKKRGLGDICESGRRTKKVLLTCNKQPSRFNLLLGRPTPTKKERKGTLITIAVVRVSLQTGYFGTGGSPRKLHSAWLIASFSYSFFFYLFFLLSYSFPVRLKSWEPIGRRTALLKLTTVCRVPPAFILLGSFFFFTTQFVGKVSRSPAKTTNRESPRVSRACSYRLFHRQRKTGEQAAYRLFRSNDFVIHTCIRALEKLRARRYFFLFFFFSFRKKPFSTDQDAITKRQLCDIRNTQKKQEQVRCGKGVMGDLFCLRSCLKNETLDWMLITFKRQRKIVEPFDRWISISINMELFVIDNEGGLMDRIYH